MARLLDSRLLGGRSPADRFPWLAGFALSVNLYLVPFTASSPRLTDLTGLLLGCWVLYRLGRGRLATGPLALLGLLCLAPAVWAFLSLWDGDPATVVLAVRWLLAAPWAAALLLVMEDPRRQEGLAWGLLAGGAVNVAVVLLQAAGLEGLLRQVGLSSSGASYNIYVAHAVRLPGLHGHHNASSAVISLVAPAGVYLYLQRRCPLWVFLAALAGLFAALHLTSTRSPLLVTAGTLAIALTAARRLGRTLVLGSILVGVMIPLLAVVGPPGGWSRWRDEQALNANAGERLQSNAGAVQISLRNPLGLGAECGKTAMADRTSYGATHNAFLQAAVVFGVPFGLLVAWGLLRSAAGSLGGADHPRFLAGLLAVQSGGLFMFEEHLNNPTFIILAAWFAAGLAWRPRPQDGTGTAAAAFPAPSGTEDLPAVP